MRHQYISAAVTVSLLLPVVASARDTAATTDIPGLPATISCSDTAPEHVGACLRDAFKHVNILRKQFQQELQAETRRWHLANDKLGLSEEYRTKFRLFLKDVAERRRAYNASVRETLRALETMRQNILQTSGSVSTVDPRRTAVRTGPSRSACRRLPDEQARACLANIPNPLDK